MTEIVKLPDPHSVVEEAARRWVQIAQEAVKARGAFHLALSGGETPRLLYQLIASPSWQEEIPWDQSHVFWGDEQRVPASDLESNYHMVHEALLDHIPIPPDQIYRMPREELANSAMRNYEDRLRRCFGLEHGEWPRFDLILLGMGEDGHIASIFPGTRAVSDLSRMVLVYEVPKLQAERMTLTLPVLNNARHILLLVTGESRAEILETILTGPHRPSTYPAQAIVPRDGKLIWLVDAAAASRLSL